MLTLIAAMVLNQADGGVTVSQPDAGLSPYQQLYASCPEPSPGDLAVELDGGIFLSMPRARFDACKQASCDAFAQAQLVTPDAESKLWKAVPPVVTGVLSTLITFYVANREARHLSLIP